MEFLSPLYAFVRFQSTPSLWAYILSSYYPPSKHLPLLFTSVTSKLVGSDIYQRTVRIIKCFRIKINENAFLCLQSLKDSYTSSGWFASSYCFETIWAYVRYLKSPPSPCAFLYASLGITPPPQFGAYVLFECLLSIYKSSNYWKCKATL